MIGRDRNRGAVDRSGVRADVHSAKVRRDDHPAVGGAVGRRVERSRREQVAARIQDCARISVEELGGDVAAAVAGSFKDAVHALRKFPGIGQPGAEKILLFAGRPAGLVPESNGLRVLVRLGLAREESSYAKTYAAGREAGSALPQKAAALQEAHLLLQLHGQTLCRNKAPACDRCPLARVCAHALALADSSPPRVGSRRR